MNSASKEPKPSSGAILSFAGILGTLLAIIFHAGAAKLSYDRNGSIIWAIVAFVFGTFYYPYYAFFVSGSAPMMGGRRMKLF
jgi:hypothetical protein